MKNSKFHTLDVKKVCEKKLDIEFRDGKEFNGWYIFKGKKVARITIPKGRKPIPRGTYRSMAIQLKLSITEFDDLLLCPLDRARYNAILEKKIL